MHSILKRLFQPLCLQVDFTQPFWNISSLAARGWLAGAVVTDLSVQYLAGIPGPLSVLASLLTLVIFWSIPARLAGAVGGLYITQAVGSLCVVTAVAALSEHRLMSDVAALLWWGWCLFASVKLTLAYIRTPKALLG